jgi:hypothetical protein
MTEAQLAVILVVAEDVNPLADLLGTSSALTGHLTPFEFGAADSFVAVSVIRTVVEEPVAGVTFSGASALAAADTTLPAPVTMPYLPG